MKTITKCRSCDGVITEFLDLGEQHVSDFRVDNTKTSKYPLVAVICDDCKLVQLRDTTPSEEMYHENYGFKSGVSDSIKNDLKDIVSTGLEYHQDVKKWLDIASNDGTLLSFVPTTVYRVGVDPIAKYCREAKLHSNRIVNGFFSAAPFTSYFSVGSSGEAIVEKFDVITSISCFYDMDDPNKFVGDVAKVMDKNSIWIVQQNYLLPTLQLNAVDNFCHEHLEYYTLLSLEPLLARHGLEVIDLSTSMVNGGSLRTIIAKKGSYPIQDAVEKQRSIELDHGLDTIEPYERFAREVWDNLKDLKFLVDTINKDEKVAYILAASTRGATIWQAAGITEDDVPYAVERNQEKVGKYFNAVGMPIISEGKARELNPDYMIVGPWFFADEIVRREQKYVRNGGKLIIPLPKLTVVDKDNIDEYLSNLATNV